MKFTVAATLGFAATVLAQDLSSLPPCGQTCIKNMLAIAQSDFGCKAGDVVCYCTNVNFGYGVRDCSNESCSAADAATVIKFGTAYCQQALAGLSSSASAAASSASVVASSASAAASGASGLSVLSAAASSETGAGASKGPASTPITTSPLVETITTDGKTSVITTGFSTIYGPVTGAASATGSAASGASSASGSAESKASSGATGTGGSGSPTGTGSGSGSGSASSSSSHGAAAPIRTAAPLLGAAAMGALFLL